MSVSIIHLKGLHTSLFPKICPVRAIDESFRFLPNCKYEHRDADQLDWNKLCGVDFRLPFQPLKAVMASWRWNPDTARFEIGFFVNDPVRGRFMSEPMAQVQPMQPFGIVIRREKAAPTWWLEIWTAGEWISEKCEVSFGNPLGWPVSGWFGGQKTAPHFMEIQRGVSLEKF
jgi:hypothetical protein